MGFKSQEHFTQMKKKYAYLNRPNYMANDLSESQYPLPIKSINAIQLHT